MAYSVAMTTDVHACSYAHLLARGDQEDLCFAIWYPSRGMTRQTALLEQVVLPLPGERRLHGNANFMPEYYERALAIALELGGGLAFMHSHLGPGWQNMGKDDINAEKSHARATLAATGLPLVGLTLGTDGAWSARFWEGEVREWCQKVRVVGEQLTISSNDNLEPIPNTGVRLTRTVSAWGEGKQADLARLHVGIVGAGSVGFLVAEALAKTGVQRLTLFDFDRVEEKNLDRLIQVSSLDIGSFKVDVLARLLRKEAVADKFSVSALKLSVCEPEGMSAALDCDVIFSCVDRPWPRNVLNLIAYAHLIPVIDGGIFAEAMPGNNGMRRADWRTHVACPSRRCLECLVQYDPSDVGLEREGMLDDPHYIAGLDESHWVNRGENVFAFSMAAASLEILQLLSIIIAPAGISNLGAQRYHFATGDIEIEDKWSCNEGCPYVAMIAKGDSAEVTLTGRHQAAEKRRAEQIVWWRRLISIVVMH